MSIEKWEPIGWSRIEHLIIEGLNGRRFTACGYTVVGKYRLRHFEYKKCKTCLRSLAKMEQAPGSVKARHALNTPAGEKEKDHGNETKTD